MSSVTTAERVGDSILFRADGVTRVLPFAECPGDPCLTDDELVDLLNPMAPRRPVSTRCKCSPVPAFPAVLVPA